MTSVAIIGGGAFGTAMACAARRARLDVKLWALEKEVVSAINGGLGNPYYLRGTPLESGIIAVTSLSEAVAGAEFALLAPPAQHMRGVAERLRTELRPRTPIVSCSKGIERGTCALMPEVITEAVPGATTLVLAGPSFAAEVARDLPTGVTLACADRSVAGSIALALSSKNFRIYTSDDPVSATVGGAFKNVLAIACGVALGRGMGENVRALLIARGFYEMARISRAKGGNPLNLLGLAGAGDVTLTCMGSQSRNLIFGIELGKGRSAAEVLASRREVTEGVHNAASFTELGKKLGVETPIAAAIDQIANHAAPIEKTFEQLLSRSTGHELGELTLTADAEVSV
ncbi:NAD(P)H-dependent glycerol-3-phosphate dehydrogenase [Pseudorhodoplanes sp.]|uniref:NAD(P)H-dependent glycerol-3-phosphate dehydrogenase n=1 Tax=Pseudorhodoplanes sp. TaxID=1934341 RepID=UPI003D12854C